MKRHPSAATSRDFFNRVFRGKTCRPSRLVLPMALSLSALVSGASGATRTWTGSAGNFFWLDAANWSSSPFLPVAGDDLVFGTVPTGTIQLGASQSANGLTFNQNFTLGAYGTNLLLTNTHATGNISVASGVLATMNASYAGTNGLSLSGGGTLFLNNPLTTFAGNISVDGAGTTLLHRAEGPTVQYNGVNGAQEFGRFDQVTLGISTAAKTITLTNGGVYKIINAGGNSEGGTKNIVIGTGGGTLNLAAGYIVHQLDDVGQIGVTTNAFTLAGKGRLILTGSTTFAAGNPLQGVVNINGGMLSLDSSVSQTVGANTYIRLLGIAGTGTTLNINSGGTLLLNGGANFFDVPQVNANNGSIIATQADALIGYAIAGVSANNKLNISGTVQILNRQLFAPQTAALPRLRSDLTGTGTLEILGGTGAGSTTRLVIERGTGSTFSGIFRLVELNSLEANPRFNATVDFGKVIADGDIQFAGWGSTLDVRDSNSAAAAQLGYTTNDLSIVTTQPGALNVISVGRATTATGTGHQFNFGGLTINGDQRLGIISNNTYSAAFTNTVSMLGNATLEMRSTTTAGTGGALTLLNATALTEDISGRTLKITKNGVGSAVATDVTSGGAISVSNVNIDAGTLSLRGANGVIAVGAGATAPTITVNGGTTSGTAGPTFGTLSLDSNGTVLGVAAANHGTNNRIVDSATLNMRGNSVLRLTNLSGIQTTETIGTTNVSGHALFDISKQGVATAPVALTLTAFNMTGTLPTANFTGTSLGLAGTDTSRIVLNPVGGTPTGFLGAQFHSGNEWAKYDNAVNSGFELGVTPFLAADYNALNTAETTWLGGQQLKINTAAATTTLTLNRNIDRLNAQYSTTSTTTGINVAGFVLSLNQGGVISSTSTMGFFDPAAAASTGGITAGTTAPAQLYVHSNAQIDIRVPVRNNLGLDGVIGGGDDNAVDFVKSGTGTVRLTHQALGIGTGTAAITPFATTPWSSTLTGSWVVNDGTLEVHRGEFLNGRPIVLNGGTLFVNQPVVIGTSVQAGTAGFSGGIIPNWGNNVIVNGNASFVWDDNGESGDGTAGGAALISLGSLAINNGSTLSYGGFGNTQAPVAALLLTGAEDAYFAGGTTISGGKATFNTGVARTGTTASLILGGAITGNGFDVVAYGGAPSTLVLGAGAGDAAANTYTDAPVIYGGIVRLNKANGTNALVDTTATEDIVLNGGSLFWGPGDHGNLTSNNNINLTNNGLAGGLAPTSPAALLALATGSGQNQIPNTANITLLTGTLGESDRITNEKFGTLIMKNGTFNVGLGTVEVDSATYSGGALGFDRGGTLKVGTANYLPGAFDQNVFTGRPVPGAYTTLEIGPGGVSPALPVLNLTGQNILLGSGFYNGNVAGAGGRLKLGGNVTFTGSDLIGGSYSRKGIFVQTGSTFRELGGTHIDLMGDVRDFKIAEDSIFTITPRITNGGISKSGGGALVLEPYEPNTFTGSVAVTAGVLQAKGDGAFGTSAGGVTVGNNATIKLDSGWSYGDDFTVTGPGSIIPGSVSVREAGALIAESSTNRLTGAFVLGGDATIAGNTFLDPSAVPGAAGLAWRIGTLVIAGTGGVTGTGTLTLSGHGDGVILNGVNTGANGLTKDGAGRWTLSGAGNYSGDTKVTAGALRISNDTALGTTAGGTTVLGGGVLELTGGISVAEPLTISGDGNSSQSGAIVNVSGSNTLTGAITLLGTTLRSDAGTLTVSGPITGGATALTLSGAGIGAVSGLITVGAPASGDVLTKNGTGTWTLSGSVPNALSGSTAVNGGTLELAAAGNALDMVSALRLGGGSVLVSASAQAVGGLSLLAGGGTVNGGAGLTVGAITRSAGATANFAGSVTTSTANVNGILGGYATYGSDWAVGNGASPISAFAGYVPLSAATLTDNASLANGQLQTASVVTNSLKIASGSGLLLGANNLALNSGGLLSASSVPGGIAGTGVISGTGAGSELIIHNRGEKLAISAPLIGAGGGALTKAGPGAVHLFGTSAFTGSININGGDLIVSNGAHPTQTPPQSGLLGGSVVGANRLINLNGGALGIYNDWDLNDWDSVAAGVQSFQFNIGSAGGTLKALFGATLTINDGSATAAGADQQLRGGGDLTFTGGGRYSLNGGTPQFLNFTGNTTVDGGILTVGHSNALGGRQEQTITLKSGSTIINNTVFGVGLNGLPNNIVAEGGSLPTDRGVEFFPLGGSRVFGGDIQLSGTNTVALFERDAHATQQQVYFNGRVTGTGITLNVFGANNGSPFYLTSGSNPITGTINLNPNAMLEVRGPGSLGVGTGDVTVNLETNSRLLLRHWQNGDYRANVVVNGHAEINSAQLANFAGGGLQILSLNNLTLNGDNQITTISGGNTYHTRVGGNAFFNALVSTILNVTASDLILENGITFSAPNSTLDKRGGFSAILRGPTNHTGKLIIQGGLVHLQDNGTLTGTTSIDLRGGELRVDNSAVTNTNRINDAATISLGGGVLRLTGVETFGNITASGGTTQIINNPISETVPNPLTLTGFTRAIGSVVQFQSPDSGAAAVAVGQNTINQTRVGSRIYLPVVPALANTGQTIPGFLGNNNLDFIQYSTANDPFTGTVLGVQDMRNPGNVNSPQNYSDNTAETAWNDAIILRRTNGTDTTTVTYTQTASRGLDAIKIETGGTARNTNFDLGTFGLRIEGGGILDVAATTHNTVFSNGTLTAGPATPGTGTAELFLGGTSTLSVVSAVIGNNSTQPVATVKTGSGTWTLGGANTYTGGTFVTQGVLNVLTNTALGAAANQITLSGGTLQFNIPSASSAVALGGLGQAINVNANSAIVLDNGALAGTDNKLAFGALNINGPYTLVLRGFDSMDASFTAATHTFAGTPLIDMAQAGSGSQASFFTINGAITGSGFMVGSSGATDNTAGILQIGSGEAVANTYTGKFTLLFGTNSVGSFSEDNRVELNKAAGTTAITGDIEINGGILRNILADQIADTSNMVINQGSYDAFGKNETIASVTMRGGNFRTSSPATGGSTVTVTGDFNATGLDDLTGSVDGVATNSNTTLNINGTLRLNGYSRGTVGGTAATLIVGNPVGNTGGLEMTGTTLLEGGAGSLIRLHGNVTTFASSNTARLGSTTTAGAQVQLNGTRTFTVADGSAGIDLSVSTALTDSTSPVAVGGLIKTGPGTMQFEGAALANAYTGTTAVNEGTVVLFKTAGTNAIPAGALTIGDGLGGTNADKVIVRLSNQIADANNVTIASSGLLDLFTFNTSEQVSSIAGSGNVDLGPGSTLTASGTTNAIFSGSIRGAGAITKGGASTWTLSGVNTHVGTTLITGGVLEAAVTNSLGGTTNVTINTGGTLLLSGAGTDRINDAATITMAGGTIAFNGNITEGSSPGTGALTLTANSFIDFAAGNSIINFGSSALAAWTSGTTLSIWNWDGVPYNGGGNDRIKFGIDTTALTAGQLSQVTFYSDLGVTSLGGAIWATSLNGEIVPVPEPSSVATVMGLLGLIGWRERRKARQARAVERRTA